MKEELRKQLLEHDKQIFQIIASATQSYLFARTLSEENENEYDLRIHLFIFHDFLYIKNTVLELYKLLQDKNNERYNFYKYLRVLEQGSKHIPALSQLKIDFWRNKINSHQPTIEAITNLRSKYYAHIDKDYLSYVEYAKSNVEFDNFENLLSDLQDFYIESNVIIFNRITGFSSIITQEYFREILSRHKIV